MTINVEINGQDIRPLLASPPRIRDNLNAVCRTLALTPYKSRDLENYLGQPVKLHYNGSIWFSGFLRSRRFNSNGKAEYTAADPLIFMKNNPDDYYFKNITANQGIKQLAEKTGVKIGKLENTGAVLSQLYYQGKDPDKIAIDLLARTYRANKKKYWFRYDPEIGLVLFERKVPKKIWTFQVGVNLEEAEYKDSIEKTVTIVKLINRETGKTVTKGDSQNINKYGPYTHFEEVDRQAAKIMDQLAGDLLKRKGKVEKSQSIKGVNPGSMPQFFSGDVIYVEEEKTKIIGAYHIKNAVQTFKSDNLIELKFDIQLAPDVPTIEYENASQPPPAKDEDKGVQQEYSEEMKKLMDKYGIDPGE